MPERVIVLTGDKGRKAFDEYVHSGLPEGGDLAFCVKERATSGKRPAICLTWSVQLPNDQLARVQTVTSLRAFLAGVRVLQTMYPEDC